MELGYAVLFLVADGRMTHFEYFEPADYQQAIVRFEEIGAETEPERLFARVAAPRQRARLGSSRTASPRTGVIDHRPIGWEPLTRAGTVEMYRSWVEIAPDLEVSFELLDGDDEHIAARYGARGHAADGGGEMEYFVIGDERAGRPRRSLGVLRS